MYITHNPLTKKQLKADVAAYNKGEGNAVTYFQAGGIFPASNREWVTIEGPHGIHRWYARCKQVDGNIVKVT